MCDVNLKKARLLACLALSSSAPREKKRGRELTRKKKKMKEKNKRKKKMEEGTRKLAHFQLGFTSSSILKVSL